MKVGFGEPRKSTRFSVRFQALGEGAIDENIAAKSNFLEVTRISQTTWSIESLDSISTGGDQALLFSMIKKRGQETIEDEGTYHMPFEITVVCATCP